MKPSTNILLYFGLSILFGCQPKSKDGQVNLATEDDSLISDSVTAPAFPYEPSKEDFETYDLLFQLLSNNEFESARELIYEKSLTSMDSKRAPLLSCAALQRSCIGLLPLTAKMQRR